MRHAPAWSPGPGCPPASGRVAGAVPACVPVARPVRSWAACGAAPASVAASCGWRRIACPTVRPDRPRPALGSCATVRSRPWEGPGPWPGPPWRSPAGRRPRPRPPAGRRLPGNVAVRAGGAGPCRVGPRGKPGPGPVGGDREGRAVEDCVPACPRAGFRRYGSRRSRGGSAEAAGGRGRAGGCPAAGRGTPSGMDGGQPARGGEGPHRAPGKGGDGRAPRSGGGQVDPACGPAPRTHSSSPARDPGRPGETQRVALRRRIQA